MIPGRNRSAVAERAAQLYDTGNYEGLIDLITSLATADADPRDTAEVYRYAFMLAHRRGDPDEHVWFTKALADAVLSGARDTAAGLLLREFFALVDKGEHGKALQVIGEIEHLVPVEHPRSKLFRPLTTEKIACCLLRQGRFRETETKYRQALAYCEGDRRGLLKVRGGPALVAYLALRRTDPTASASSADPCRAELAAMYTEANAAGYGDVADVASRNLQSMKQMEFEPWFAFETK